MSWSRDAMLFWDHRDQIIVLLIIWIIFIFVFSVFIFILDKVLVI